MFVELGEDSLPGLGTTPLCHQITPAQLLDIGASAKGFFTCSRDDQSANRHSRGIVNCARAFLDYRERTRIQRLRSIESENRAFLALREFDVHARFSSRER